MKFFYFYQVGAGAGAAPKSGGSETLLLSPPQPVFSPREMTRWVGGNLEVHSVKLFYLLGTIFVKEAFVKLAFILFNNNLYLPCYQDRGYSINLSVNLDTYLCRANNATGIAASGIA